jgi:molybdate transport system substrate-binding protein
VFLSADVDYPTKLVASGHADGASLYQYATGRIVLWTRRASGIDLSKGLGVLREPAVKRIAIANPQHAPYGRAAVDALKSSRLYDVVQPKLVLGENISQAAQLVDSGNAEVGILALSVALGQALRAGVYFEVPSSAHPPIQQAAVVLNAARNVDRARQLLAFFKRPATIQLLQRFGFTPPPLPSR